ncbi:LOW QUALITY PROTEIN: putative inorganic phosphate cotransporter [Dermatophagoides pteronyssinus]|uniref:LOW QUALITY PROTEIN: putative inorganic phosphate cotransporter n=1 Tax=Dermatophagoides pteronyssinus TaxID=6956 RepID=UPI003F669BB1
MQFGKRHLISILCLCSSMMGYIGRINLSTAIVAMARDESINKTDHKEFITDVCPDPKIIGNNSKPVFDFQSSTAQRFDWNQKTQGVILGAFFYGYFALQIGSGRLAEIFGPRILCSLGLFMSGIINLLTPLISNHYGLLITSRILLGVFQAAIFPSCYALSSRWIPDHERSTINSMAFIGGDLGSLIASTLAGYLSRHGFAGGWPSVFYVSGTLITAFSILYFLLVRDDPSLHWIISDSELKYIQAHIKRKKQIETSVSWLRLLSSRVIWAGAFTHFTMIWSLTVFVLKIPEYMHHVLKIPLEKNGLFSALMYMGECSSLLITGIIVDRIIKSERYDKTLVRKICQSITQFGGGICLLLVAVANCNERLFLAATTGTMILNGLQSGGLIALPSDLSNNFSATIFGIFNMIGMTNGFICPLIIGYVLDSDPHHIKHGWWTILYITAALRIAGGIVFTLFISCRRRSWSSKNTLSLSTSSSSLS